MKAEESARRDSLGSWEEFTIMEIEEAYAQRKDPSSNSRITCFKKCLAGPKERSCSSKVANIVHFLVIMFNVLGAVKFSDEKWVWLVFLNILLGCLTWILILIV